MLDCLLCLAIAFLTDGLLGDPSYRFHPVRCIGRLIATGEKGLRSAGLSGRCGGLLLVLIVLTSAAAVYLGIRRVLVDVTPALPKLWDCFVVYSCLALRDLIRHAQPIRRALTRNALPQARRSLQAIVGRSTERLNASQIARAAVESVAESFLDGVLSPLFWFSVGACLALLASLPPLPSAVLAVLIFKTVSTMDSMIGYRNELYRSFGTAAARLDDILNFLPARLSIGALWLAALLTGADHSNGLKTARRDRLKHASPNSAHPESFVAGALGIRLGGPTTYPHGTVEKPWLGEPGNDAGPQHIAATCRLVGAAGWISLLLCAMVVGFTVVCRAGMGGH